MDELLKLQEEYVQQHKDDYFIFPLYWFDIDNVDLKIEVLKRAIKQNKLIIDVEGGSYFVEGVTLSKT